MTRKRKSGELRSTKDSGSKQAVEVSVCCVAVMGWVEEWQCGGGSSE